MSDVSSGTAPVGAVKVAPSASSSAPPAEPKVVDTGGASIAASSPNTASSGATSATVTSPSWAIVGGAVGWSTTSRHRPGHPIRTPWSPGCPYETNHRHPHHHRKPPPSPPRPRRTADTAGDKRTSRSLLAANVTRQRFRGQRTRSHPDVRDPRSSGRSVADGRSLNARRSSGRTLSPPR